MKRLVRLFGGGLAHSRGPAGKWAMWRCIVGWMRSRLGRPGRAAEVRLRVDGLDMTVDAARLEITPYWELWFEGGYELLPGFVAREDSCVVDVGGNVGFYAIRQARRARAGRVIAFEPSPSVFSRLKRNVESNGLNNVQVVNAALGASAGRVHFLESAWSINCRVVPEAVDGSIEVACDTLDAALQRAGVGRIDILKIDTEGFERAVLAGAAGTLPRVQRIVLEVHKDVEGEKRQVDDILRPHGFAPTARQGSLIYYERTANGA